MFDRSSGFGILFFRDLIMYSLLFEGSKRKLFLFSLAFQWEESETNEKIKPVIAIIGHKATVIF